MTLRFPEFWFSPSAGLSFCPVELCDCLGGTLKFFARQPPAQPLNSNEKMVAMIKDCIVTSFSVSRTLGAGSLATVFTNDSGHACAAQHLQLRCSANAASRQHSSPNLRARLPAT